MAVVRKKWLYGFKWSKEVPVCHTMPLRALVMMMMMMVVVVVMIMMMNGNCCIMQVDNDLSLRSISSIEDAPLPPDTSTQLKYVMCFE